MVAALFLWKVMTFTGEEKKICNSVKLACSRLGEMWDSLQSLLFTLLIRNIYLMILQLLSLNLRAVLLYIAEK